MKKSYLAPRVLAYFIDALIVSMVVGLLNYVLPVASNYNDLQEELVSVQEQYGKNEIGSEAYIRQTALLTYDIDRAAALTYIADVTVVILYFVIYQFYSNGQTLGKKLMKIQVVGIDDKKLTINDYLYRGVISHAILANILIVILLMFMSRDNYFYVSFPLQLIQIVLLLITIFMVLFKKDGRGLHDKVAHSIVVMKK